MAAPPAEIPLDSDDTAQTAANTFEASPEVILNRVNIKRTSTTSESEFVDRNDINEMAPSSAILHSGLPMNDAGKINDEIDVSEGVTLANSIQSSSPPAPKRVRYSNTKDGLTASDYAQLKPVIQPENNGITFSRSTPHCLSRKREIADLVHPSSQCSPVDMDEPEATIIYGEPVDSSSSTLSIEISEEEEPFTPSLTTRYPGSSHVTAGGSLSPKSPKEMEGKTRNFNSRGSISSISHDDKRRSLPSISAPSSLFMPSHATRPRRNSCSTKKGFQRPVRIQLLDEAESDKIREEGRHLFPSSQSSSPSISEHGLSWGQDQGQDQEADSGDITLRNGVDDEQSVALPIEDPIVHDWDMEELDDEESEGSATPSAEDSSASTENIKDRMTKSPGKELSHKLARIRKASISQAVNVRGQDAVGEEDGDDDDKWDPTLDPEREVSTMSEDQEVELYNIHMRLENQRDFQDASSLDLGERDGQSISEDGRYGGAIEADDEGEDFWENR
ncbi:hypothetical protein BGX21_006838 [Mortierella sp. AD011]|nr:hypothetical protein BGX20_009301 [Mortierella sp. AD010]KAF9403139.1 hypothetical protein BGX21_006838 [Mortierella sp. AD011]